MWIGEDISGGDFEILGLIGNFELCFFLCSQRGFYIACLLVTGKASRQIHVIIGGIYCL